MNTKLEKIIDRTLGGTICILLGLFKCSRKTKTPKKIVIVRLWAIGESILTLPMIHSLKKKFPQSQIDILVRNKPYQQIFYKNKDINKLIYWSPLNLLKFFKKYDIAIDTEPYLNISAISSFMFAKKSIGFKHGIRSFVYNIKIHYNDQQPVPLTYMDMLKPFNIKEIPKKLIKLQYPKKAELKINKVLKENKIKKTDLLIGFFAGASENDKSRRWPTKKFVELGNILTKKYNAKIILTGLNSEKELNREITKGIKNKVLDLTGKTSLYESIALIEKCDLFISNDSGPMHISAAQGTKTIGLFGPNLPIRFGAYGPKNINIRKETMKPCINVHLGQIPQCGHDHMSKIKVKDVLIAVEKLLKK